MLTTHQPLLLWGIFLSFSNAWAQYNIESFNGKTTTPYFTLSYATATTIDGKQQDRFSPCRSKSTNFFGLYDGHGKNGDLVAEDVRNCIESSLESMFYDHVNLENKLKNIFLQTNNSLKNLEEFTASGTTATVAFFAEKLLIANIGDSEAIIYLGNLDFFDENFVSTVTYKHHAQARCEYQRLIDFGDENEMVDNDYSKKAWLSDFVDSKLKIQNFDQDMHPLVEQDNTTGAPLIKRKKLKYLCTTDSNGRTKKLLPTRVMGDFQFDPFVTAEPSVKTVEITKPCFVLLASDGLWDLISKKAVAQFICHKASEFGKDNPQLIMHDLMTLVLNHAHHYHIQLDDITATLIFVTPQS